MMKKNEVLEQVFINKYRFPLDISIKSHLYCVLNDFEETALGTADLLEAFLSLKPKTFNFSLKSLKLLGHAINKHLTKTNSNFREQYYQFLTIIYCGEVMRRQTGGDWVFKSLENETFDQVLIMEQNNTGFFYQPEMLLTNLLAADWMVELESI